MEGKAQLTTMTTTSSPIQATMKTAWWFFTEQVQVTTGLNGLTIPKRLLLPMMKWVKLYWILLYLGNMFLL